MALTPLTLYTIGRKLIQTSNGDVSRFKSPVGLLTMGYGSRPLTQAIAVVTIVALFPYLTLQIAGVGKFIVSFSDGQVSYILATLICCAVVGLYLVKGGAKADIETDFWQGLIMLVATVVIAGYVGWLFFQDGDVNIAALNEAGLLSLPGPKGYFNAPMLISFGVIFGLITIATPQVSRS
ncbi:MAG: hypothetical protein IPP26_00005 [Flavobacteriales bacterium]|nr:hypothetical protein [Flavobacteriales bacterium]